MNTHWKNGLLAIALAGIAGGSLVFAQATPTVSSSPPAAGGARGAAGTGRGRGGAASHQPHMDTAIARLEEARNQLDLAAHDKGGFREKAIASVDHAIADVQAGIDYAEAHPEEFTPAGRGARGAAAGTRAGAEATVIKSTAAGG